MKRFSPELASLNAGSMNFALFHVLDHLRQFKFEWERDYLAMTEDFTLSQHLQDPAAVQRVLQGTANQTGIRDLRRGMLHNLAFLIERGWVQTPVYLQFVLGILGGMQATLDNLMFLYHSAKELIQDFQWSVCAAGKHQFRMGTAALLLGGHVRVGLEDNLYLEKGRLARSSGEQVAKIIRIARELGREPATPAEARQILGLKGLDKVNF